VSERPADAWLGAPVIAVAIVPIAIIISITIALARVEHDDAAVVTPIPRLPDAPVRRIPALVAAPLPAVDRMSGAAPAECGAAAVTVAALVLSAASALGVRVERGRQQREQRKRSENSCNGHRSPPALLISTDYAIHESGGIPRETTSGVRPSVLAAGQRLSTFTPGKQFPAR
jgi:hypothetical protein